MIRSSVTISLVPEAKGGPFVFWGDLEGSCAKAARLGFDAVEIFAPSPEVLRKTEVKDLLGKNKLTLAAAGTGAGWLLHKLRKIRVCVREVGYRGLLRIVSYKARRMLRRGWLSP